MEGLGDILRHELIGLDIEIVKAKNKALEGIEGKIIYETKNLLHVETKKGVKKIIKDQVTIRLRFNGKMLEINGKLLALARSTILSKHAPEKLSWKFSS